MNKNFILQVILFLQILHQKQPDENGFKEGIKVIMLIVVQNFLTFTANSTLSGFMSYTLCSLFLSHSHSFNLSITMKIYEFVREKCLQILRFVPPLKGYVGKC